MVQAENQQFQKYSQQFGVWPDFPEINIVTALIGSVVYRIFLIEKAGKDPKRFAVPAAAKLPVCSTMVVYYLGWSKRKSETA